jgi:hypothetical protein
VRIHKVCKQCFAVESGMRNLHHARTFVWFSGDICHCLADLTGKRSPAAVIRRQTSTLLLPNIDRGWIWVETFTFLGYRDAFHIVSIYLWLVLQISAPIVSARSTRH